MEKDDSEMITEREAIERQIEILSRYDDEMLEMWIAANRERGEQLIHAQAWNDTCWQIALQIQEVRAKDRAKC